MPAIVPGKPEESEVIFRITSSDSDEVMPPADSKKPPLAPEAVAKVRQWIAQGAPYEAHWAFIAPERPMLPGRLAVDANPIDVFIEERRKAAGLTASPRAEPETLCRRLWLDLTGLPPSTKELDAFLQSYSKSGDAAYRSLVDQLLASPRYGEKWARHWLDVARYADSDGYEKDLPREQWAWRDWVIDAYNADLPYNRFIIEQVAGDLLAGREPDPVKAQALRIATGYLRNSMICEEGAIIPEQYRMEGMFDRLDAIGKGVLGLTLQCAQCHTHKFDPITHDDYYSTFAFLNNTYEATSRVYSDKKLSEIERLEREIAAVESRIKAETPDWPLQLAAWVAQQEQRERALSWQIIAPTEAVWRGGLSHPEILPDGSILSLGFRPTDGELVVTARPKLSGASGIRLEALTHGDLIFGGPGRNIDGLFAVSELDIEARVPGKEDWLKLALVDASADFESPERRLPKLFQKETDKEGKKREDKRTLGPAAFLIDGKIETAWAPDRGPGRRNAPHEFVARFKEPLDLPEGTTLRVTLRFKHGGRDGNGRHNQHLGRFRLALTSASAPAVSASTLTPDARAALASPPKDRSAADESALFSAWIASTPEFASARAEIEKLWALYPAHDTTVLHLAERSREDRRETFLLERGAWDKPKRRVSAATPHFLHEMAPSDYPPRLAFARWLVDPRSPTTARVAVNRIWQALFGQGLAETPADFGVRAPAASQPEVLDWLAVDFMEHGWSRKELIRKIVTSATYRQSSRVTPELLERDPRNRLLARGPRFRVDAEVVRDIALRVSGLLTEKQGGPSIFSPVPESLFATSFIPVDFWKTATGSVRYRRSLYTFRRRSMPDPVLASFDAPNGDTACARRERSNTPLAALASLNEIVFVEAAQAFALRILKEGGTTDAERAAFAFRACTARVAKPAQIAEILDLLEASRSRLADGWISASEIATGDSAHLPKLPPNTTPADAAVWTIAARVLLNLDETLTKN